jgi:hypothetical protein
MKTNKSILIAILTIISYLGYAQDSSVKSTVNSGSKSEKSKFCCSMHPDVVSDNPGKCPKCNMNLVQSKKEIMKSEVMKLYQCPMHSNEKSDKPGKCKKCNMEMKEK